MDFLPPLPMCSRKSTGDADQSRWSDRLSELTALLTNLLPHHGGGNPKQVTATRHPTLKGRPRLMKQHASWCCSSLLLVST